MRRIPSKIADKSNVPAINTDRMNQLLKIPIVYAGMMSCCNVKLPIKNLSEIFCYSNGNQSFLQTLLMPQISVTTWKNNNAYVQRLYLANGRLEDCCLLYKGLFNVNCYSYLESLLVEENEPNTCCPRNISFKLEQTLVDAQGNCYSF